MAIGPPEHFWKLIRPPPVKWHFFRLSEFFFYPLLARLNIWAGVEQPFGCLVVQNRQAV